MPLLKDAVSKLTFSQETKNKLENKTTEDQQEPYKTSILRWMQNSPAAMRDTTTARLARTIAVNRVTPQKEQDVLFTLYTMTRDGVIVYSGHNSTRRKTFYINYMHKNIPKEVREKATQEELNNAEKVLKMVVKKRQKMVKRAKSYTKQLKKLGAAEGTAIEQEIDKAAGATVKDEVKEATEEVAETPVETPAETPVETPVETPTEVVSTPTLNVPVELEKMPSSFTLQLNINFTINGK